MHCALFKWFSSADVCCCRLWWCFWHNWTTCTHVQSVRRMRVKRNPVTLLWYRKKRLFNRLFNVFRSSIISIWFVQRENHQMQSQWWMVSSKSQLQWLVKSIKLTCSFMNYRSVGCFLILIFHMNWYMHFSVHNQAMMFAYGEQTLWQWVGTTPIIVDVFFTIRWVQKRNSHDQQWRSIILFIFRSGLLLSYNFLRNESKIREIQLNGVWANLKLFGKQLLHRYMR